MGLFSRKPSEPPPSTNPFLRPPDVGRQKPAAAESGQVENPWLKLGASVPPPPPAPVNRGGRPRSQNPRTKKISVTFTPQEYDVITEGARSFGYESVAPWVREMLIERLLSRPMRDPSAEADAAKLLGEVARIGSNLNQLTKAVNTANVEGRAVDAVSVAAEVRILRAQLAGLQERALNEGAS